MNLLTVVIVLIMFNSLKH